jgi:hypothetical protein
MAAVMSVNRQRIVSFIDISPHLGAKDCHAMLITNSFPIGRPLQNRLNYCEMIDARRFAQIASLLACWTVALPG